MSSASLLPPAVEVLLGSHTLVVLPDDAAHADGLHDRSPGRLVGLADRRPFSRRRLRRAASRLGLETEAEYAVLPSWDRAAFVVEDHASTLSWTFSHLVTVPPGICRGAHLADVALRVVRLTGTSRWTARLAPGRLLIGRWP